jgi:hypothetical protein
MTLAVTDLAVEEQDEVVDTLDADSEGDIGVKVGDEVPEPLVSSDAILCWYSASSCANVANFSQSMGEVEEYEVIIGSADE